MNRMLNLLGLCMRAGKVLSGEKVCVQAVRDEGVYAVILDGAAAKNAVKAVTDACSNHAVPLLRTGPDELGFAIGKPGRMVAAITDPSLANKLLQLNESKL